MNELLLVDRLRRISGKGGGVIRGIGDDCAVFRPKAAEDLLLKIDQLIEGVHFPASMLPEVVGERALARALSDIAAAGGDPRCCLVALAVPRTKADRWILLFFGGLLRLAERTGTVLAGGDLAHDDKVHCSVMVVGAVKRGKALTRAGARPGDHLYVSGRLGKPWDQRIEPRLALGRKLAGKATACIDLSDGLALDLHRLCKESRVAAQVESVPMVQGVSLERALQGGEDYELLFTMPPRLKPPAGTTRIGTIVRGNAGTVWFEGQKLEPRGYDHFA
ncbi:MAG: thiamine-monophosphate kinase [Bryobacterales bacterium]|nr:thiamine-monophosphate kinase [Bryobacterales bacterium]